MDFNFLNTFLFHPRKSHQLIGNNDILIDVDTEIHVGIRLYIVNQASPTILFFHGNGEIVTDYDDIGQVYNQKNINFIISDYRGYGFSNGSPNSKNILADADKIFNFIIKKLKNENYTGSLFIMGRSLGSTCAIELTNRYPDLCQGLIIESGFADENPLFSLIGTTAEQIGFSKDDGFLNGEKIKNYKGKLLIIHATEDHIIPFNQGEILLNNCPSKNKALIPISNANHNNILSVNINKYFEVIENFIGKED